jgi:hypothetical protein
MSILATVIWAAVLATLWGTAAYLAATVSENPRRKRRNNNER